MDSDLREEIFSILKASGEMTVATVRPDGYPQATTVNYVSDGLVIFRMRDRIAEGVEHSVQRQGFADGYAASL